MRRRPRLALGAWTGLVLVFLYLPLVTVAVNAFNADATLVGWGGFTFRWISEAAADDRVRQDFISTLTVAVATTLVSLAVALSAGLWTRRAAARGVGVVDATNYMRIALPEVVLAIGLFVMFKRLNLPSGMVAIVLGHVVFTSAYAFVVIQARLATMGTSLEEAAVDLGASPWRTFRRVTMPMLAPAIGVAGFLVFSISADNVLVSLFMGGNTETVPVLILGLARREITPMVNAIAVLFALLTVIALLVVIAVTGMKGLLGMRASRASGRREGAELP